MRTPLIAAALTALTLLANPAWSANAACEAQASEKKLAGAAKTSFMKKCEREAGGGSAAAKCEQSASEKKLYGAAKTSHVKKCIADAAASK